MNSIWRNFLGLFKKDPLFARTVEECHETIDRLEMLFTLSLSLLGRLPAPPPPFSEPATEKALALFSEEARKKVLTHISSSGPGHVVAGMVMLTMVIDLEKLSENVRQVRGIAFVRPKPLAFGDLEDDVADVEQRTLALFHDMKKAVQGQDVEFSRDVIARYKGGLTKACDALLGRLLAGEAGDLSPADTAAAPLYLMSLKRTGLHCRNMITGIASPYARIGARDNR